MLAWTVGVMLEAPAGVSEAPGIAYKVVSMQLCMCD